MSPNPTNAVALPPSAVALDEVLLDYQSPAARKIRKAIDHTSRWRYRRGHSVPDAKNADLMHRASGGRIARNGWGTKPAVGRPRRKATDETAGRKAA
jgi:hypothetical protein